MVIVNPPAYAGGYEKMFNMNNIIEYKIDVPMFSNKHEAGALYYRNKQLQCQVLWFKARDLYWEIDGVKQKVPIDDVLFAKEYNLINSEFWMATKPEVFANHIYSKSTCQTKHVKSLPYKNAKIFSDEDELTPETKVQWITVSPEHALYYRDLFAHKLGTVKAETHRILLLDGKVFGICGFHLEKLRGFKSDKIFETYGFNATLKRYSNSNRLLMMLLTCREFEKSIFEFSGKGRTFSCSGIRTTCLSKYRKVKSNNGLLIVTDREKMSNDMYKIHYETNWHERTYSDCIRLYLEENNGTREHLETGKDN